MKSISFAKLRTNGMMRNVAFKNPFYFWAYDRYEMVHARTDVGLSICQIARQEKRLAPCMVILPSDADL